MIIAVRLVHAAATSAGPPSQWPANTPPVLSMAVVPQSGGADIMLSDVGPAKDRKEHILLLNYKLLHLLPLLQREIETDVTFLLCCGRGTRSPGREDWCEFDLFSP